ncbi:hypothetical protein [Kutzneria sp. NPDC052558]|uniref:hypothetical protein n=1 Tax=Kutzneria sp. NPDC052558 TaxID=3364121 RepID=UPI0037CC80C5
MEDTQLSVAVWRPAEQWQADDKAVELRMQGYARRSRTMAIGIVVPLVLAAAMFGLHSIGLMVLFLLNAAWGLISGVRHQMRVGRWLPAARSLLSGNPSHRVAARVVAHKGNRTVLAVGPMHLRVEPVLWGTRQVIARTGEITMVGPDAEGHAVVFVDGQPMPLPAKVVEAPEPMEAEPIARVSANAAEDAVTQWFATRFARLMWAPAGILVLMLAALAFDAQQSRFSSIWIVFVGLLICAIVLTLRMTDQTRLPKLLKTGQWQAHPVTVEEWKGNVRVPAGDLTVKLGVPGGEYRLVVKQASAELVANVSATGTLWMVGQPTARKPAAVGVPGYPIVAIARFQ